MGKRKKIILFYGLFFLFFLIIGGFTFAQRPLEVPLPGTGGEPGITTTPPLPDYIKYIFNFSLGIMGLIVFGALVYAGFRFLTSVGDPAKRKDAKDRIIAAFLGLAVLLFSYMILDTINPQLTILDLPGRTIFFPEPIIGNIVTGPGLLAYAEVPFGGIIEQLFLEERLTRIKDTSGDLKDQAEKVKDVAVELKALTDACSCSNVDRGYRDGKEACVSGSCGGSLECTSNCYCSGDPYTGYDPCSNRDAIDAKRAELRSENEVLRERQKKFQPELDDFRKLYNNLLDAEEKIKNCSQTTGANGSPRVVFDYNEFWVYRQKLEDDKLISGVAPERPYLPITSETAYKQSTFYCSDTPYPFVESQGADITLFNPEEELKTPPQKVLCEKEIPIGETIDNAEELARRMLVEMDNINENALGEIIKAEVLAELPPNCIGSNCGSNMNTSRSCCQYDCAECYTPPLPEPIPEPEPDPWWWFFMAKTAYAFPATDCEAGCSLESCVSDACTSCACVCTGSPCPAGIGILVAGIIEHYGQIERSREVLIDLIEERVEDKLKISNIFKVLEDAQEKLGACYNPKERYKALELSETTNWEQLSSCSYVKDVFENGAPLYSEETREELKECYGPSADGPDLMDNFFCCFYLISFEEK